MQSNLKQRTCQKVQFDFWTKFGNSCHSDIERNVIGREFEWTEESISYKSFFIYILTWIHCYLQFTYILFLIIVFVLRMPLNFKMSSYCEIALFEEQIYLYSICFDNINQNRAMWRARIFCSLKFHLQKL